MEAVHRLVSQVLKGLTRQPGYAVTAVTTLSVGVAATTAVFALAYSVLLRPLPYPDPEQLVGVWYNVPSPSGPARVRQSEATYLHLRDSSESFDAVGLAQPTAATFFDGERPTRIPAADVTSTLFDVLQVTPAMGRPLTPDDNLPGAEPVIMLAHSFWETMFGRDPAILDQVIQVDGVNRRVVGVLPASVKFPEENTAVWIPQTIDEADPLQMVFFHAGYARLTDSATLELAYDDVQRQIFSIPDVYTEFPKALVETGQITPIILPLRDQLVGETGGALWVLLAAVCGLFLVACVNVANLAMVRLEGRTHELAVRRALGATQTRVASLLVGESTALALVSGALGLAGATLALQAFLGAAPDLLPRSNEVRVDGIVVAFAALLSLMAGLISGGIPAFRRFPSVAALGGGGRTAGGTAASQRVRKILVVAQVAVSVVLLVGSGLLVRSFLSLRDLDPGFDTTDVVGLRVALPEAEYAPADTVGQFYRLALDEVRGLPGVTSAASVTHLPLRDHRLYLNYEAEGKPPDPLEITPSYLTKVVSTDYFRTLGIELLQGRTLERADEDVEGDIPAVVSSVFADHHWPDGDALGSRFRESGPSTNPWLTVVGIVESSRDRSLMEEPQGIVYLPFLADYLIGAGELQWRDMSIAVRANRPTDLVPAIRDVLLRLDANVPVSDVRTMEAVLAGATAQTRFVAILLLIAACGTLFLGAVGLYGIMAYSVGERRRELGVRLALGAYPQQLRRMVTRQAMAIAVIGLGIGAVLSASTTRLLQGLLYGVAPSDPVTLTAVSVLLLLVCLLAAGIPSLRAARTDPAVVLRD